MKIGRDRSSGAVPFRLLNPFSFLWNSRYHPTQRQFRAINDEAWALLADDFYEKSFLALAVEFVVENMLPGSEMEGSVGDCDHDLTAHYLPLHVSVGVVFVSVVPILAVRFFGRELFEPDLVIVM